MWFVPPRTVCPGICQAAGVRRAVLAPVTDEDLRHVPDLPNHDMMPDSQQGGYASVPARRIGRTKCRPHLTTDDDPGYAARPPGPGPAPVYSTTNAPW